MCFQPRIGRERDPPEKHRFDTVGPHPALNIAEASCGKPESLITNEVHTVFGALADSMSQSSGII